MVPLSTLLLGLACGPSSGFEEVGGSPGLHEIILGGRGAEEHVVPQNIAVRSGSEVHFVTADNRVHTVHFQLEDMAEAARQFIQSTEQFSSPPLITRGTRYIVSFENAPRGFYPFTVRAHGEPVAGAVVVE